jgi:release factor glutamine methyltransferase
LLAPEDGLAIYRRLLLQAPKHLNPQGCLVFEIGSGQGKAACEMCAEMYQVELLPDLGGRDRVIIARKKV